MHRLLLATTTAVFSTLSLASYGQEPSFKKLACTRWADASEMLRKDYDEEEFFTGVRSDGKAKIIITVSPQTGSWTMNMVFPNKIACLITAGKHFKITFPEIKPDERKS